MPKYCVNCGSNSAGNFCADCGRPQPGVKPRPDVDFKKYDENASGGNDADDEVSSGYIHRSQDWHQSSSTHNNNLAVL